MSVKQRLLLIFLACFTLSLHAQVEEETTMTSTDSVIAPVEAGAAEGGDDDEGEGESEEDSGPVTLRNDEPYFFDTVEVNRLDHDKWKQVTKDVNYNEEVPKPEEPEDTSFRFDGLGEGIKIAVYILGGIVLALLLFFVLKDIGPMLRARKKFIPDDEPEITTYEDVDLNSLDYLIKMSLESNDLRSAVRYQYLGIIRNLAQQRIIRLRKEKTNRDYLTETDDTALYPEFKAATMIFNRVWYGNLLPDEETYRQISNRFVALAEQINRTERAA